MRKNARIVAVLGAVLAGASTAGASVIAGNAIYSDTFANSGSGAINLNGYSPNLVDAGGESWVSASAPAGSGATDAIWQIPAGGGLTLYVPIPSPFGDLLPLEAPGERSERGASSGWRDRVRDLGTLPAVPRLSWIRRPFMQTARTVTRDEPLRLGPAFARMGWP